MRPQIEKNMEELVENIEQLSGEEMTDRVAEHLSVYHGAYKALCMVCKAEEAEDTPVVLSSVTEAVDGLEGDTEFDRLIMSIPADRKHMVGVMNIISDHMEGLKIINNRKYEAVMMRLREVART
jgi:hypothetical protein